MVLRVSNEEFFLLRKFFEEQYAIVLGNDKAYLIETRLSGLAEEMGFKTFGELYRKLKNASKSEKISDLIVDAITTKETFWFRDQYPFQILQEQMIPDFFKEIAEGIRSGIRIWSAACSSGQEPYSIAMAVLDFYINTGCEAACYDQVKIIASDISPNILSYAQAGNYNDAAIRRGLPSTYHHRFFKRNDKSWVIDDKIKKLVTFMRINLKDPILSTLGPFDVIFLRNIIIYFSDEQKKILFRRIARLLSPNGCLFLGTGETVSGYTDMFDITYHGNAIYYTLKACQEK